MTEKPVIYQIFTRLFGNRQDHPVVNGNIRENGCGKMDDIDEGTISRIRQMGVTHIWLTGIIRHATTTDYTSAGIPSQTPMVVKGKAGSPYAITDYYDVDPDLAVDVERRMEEFVALVGRIHQAGMKVVIDFVPNHVAREYRSVCKPETVRDLGQDDDTFLHFSTRNNFYYCWGHALDVSQLPAAEGPVYHEQPARATGNDQFGWCPQANDWYETVKINYGIDYCDAGGRSEHFSPIPDTWGKMTDILLFWAAKGVDAFRCDMAEMVPAAFWHWATDKVKFAYQNVRFIGEVYDPRQYRNYIAAGFDYLYDKVGMYDCLREVICGRRRAADITQQWQVNDDILSHMLYFLENHDEQRVASDFFAADARKGIPGMMVCAWLNSSPVMVYAGQEFGERGMDAEGFSGLDGRTTIFDYWTVDTLRRGFFDRRRLKKTEKSLLDSYSTILSLANQEEALCEGAFYDLMYVNPQMAERQFAFMRKKDNQLMLIVVNFDEKAVDCQVNIPEHVFGWWQLSEGHFPATDLLTGEKSIVALSPNHPVGLTVPALGGCLIRIKN
jgi:glycosidase